MLSEIISTIPLEVLWRGLSIFLITSFIWLPPLLGYGLVILWVRYIRKKFFASQKYILLEIILPKEMKKSPLGMEVFLNQLAQTGGEGTWWDKYIKGKTRPWFSLELVSIEGNVKFLIWTRAFWRKFIESQIYAQFPDVEILEVPDYTVPIYYDPAKVSMWGADFKLTDNDAIPIKTYIDYGLDKEVDPEKSIDPLTAMLEFLGSIGKGEQIWIQIIVRAHKKERFRKGVYEKTDWKDDAKKAIADIQKIGKDRLEKEGGSGPGLLALTTFEQEKIKAIQRSQGKAALDCGIRAIYLADKDHFDGIMISGLTSVFKQYSSPALNGFAPTRWMTVFSYPWQDYKNIRQNRVKTDILDAYKRRSYFFEPYKTEPFILNIEELATIFHFPGKVAATPTVDRIKSKKKEPPANLPI